MTKKIKMVVFDMAGTTIDEQNVVYKTLQKSIHNYGIAVSLKTVLEFGAGKEKHQAIKDILQYLKSDKINDSKIIFNNFTSLLKTAYKKLEVLPIKGVERVLLNLKSNGVKVVLNTGYSRDFAVSLLEKIEWDKGVHFDLLVTASDVKNGRPHPEMIEKAIKQFNIEPKYVLKAGDSVIDIQEGKNANCGITVGVLSGAQTKEQLKTAKPNYILNSLANLETIL